MGDKGLVRGFLAKKTKKEVARLPRSAHVSHESAADGGAPTQTVQVVTAARVVELIRSLLDPQSRASPEVFTQRALALATAAASLPLHQLPLLYANHTCLTDSLRNILAQPLLISPNDTAAAAAIAAVLNLVSWDPRLMGRKEESGYVNMIRTVLSVLEDGTVLRAMSKVILGNGTANLLPPSLQPVVRKGLLPACAGSSYALWSPRLLGVALYVRFWHLGEDLEEFNGNPELRRLVDVLTQRLCKREIVDWACGVAENNVWEMPWEFLERLASSSVGYTFMLKSTPKIRSAVVSTVKRWDDLSPSVPPSNQGTPRWLAYLAIWFISISQTWSKPHKQQLLSPAFAAALTRLCTITIACHPEAAAILRKNNPDSPSASTSHSTPPASDPSISRGRGASSAPRASPRKDQKVPIVAGGAQDVKLQDIIAWERVHVSDWSKTVTAVCQIIFELSMHQDMKDALLHNCQVETWLACLPILCEEAADYVGGMLQQVCMGAWHGSAASKRKAMRALQLKLLPHLSAQEPGSVSDMLVMGDGHIRAAIYITEAFMDCALSANLPRPTLHASIPGGLCRFLSLDYGWPTSETLFTQQAAIKTIMLLASDGLLSDVGLIKELLEAIVGLAKAYASQVKTGGTEVQSNLLLWDSTLARAMDAVFMLTVTAENKVVGAHDSHDDDPVATANTLQRAIMLFEQGYFTVLLSIISGPGPLSWVGGDAGGPARSGGSAGSGGMSRSLIMAVNYLFTLRNTMASVDEWGTWASVARMMKGSNKVVEGILEVGAGKEVSTQLRIAPFQLVAMLLAGGHKKEEGAAKLGGKALLRVMQHVGFWQEVRRVVLDGKGVETRGACDRPEVELLRVARQLVAAVWEAEVELLCGSVQLEGMGKEAVVDAIEKVNASLRGVPQALAAGDMRRFSSVSAELSAAREQLASRAASTGAVRQSDEASGSGGNRELRKAEATNESVKENEGSRSQTNAVAGMSPDGGGQGAGPLSRGGTGKTAAGILAGGQDAESMGEGSSRDSRIAKNKQKVRGKAQSTGGHNSAGVASEPAGVASEPEDSDTTGSLQGSTDNAHGIAVQADRGCVVCGTEGDEMFLCGGCRAVRYCSQQCQRANWKGHRKRCREVHAQREGMRL